MLEQHIKVMSLLQKAGDITGRKKLQKMIYIGKKLGMPFYEKYDFRRYGPYSEELSLRLEELHQFGFISEVREEKAGYHQYRYELAPMGEHFLAGKAERATFAEQETIITEMNACSSKFLELISTVLFLEPARKEEVIRKVHTLKKTQNYSGEDIDRAYSYIERWKQQAK
ncbi:YwgA family protein [Natribacillus halophilus]|uniref:YwgA family protein n=1 Tax=Natribacillus halophilus TaxID=549003 RepID=A0A1G8KZ68_9BACI|nr:hypothetical protein [Natribacillus halophilus]SDI48702.1 hypothetical protein SAMN04488123_102393 [Natribacillus halophilus]